MSTDDSQNTSASGVSTDITGTEARSTSQKETSRLAGNTRAYAIVASIAIIISLLSAIGSFFVWYTTSKSGPDFIEISSQTRNIMAELEKLQLSHRTAQVAQDSMRQDIESNKQEFISENEELREKIESGFALLQEQQIDIEDEFKSDYDTLVDSIDIVQANSNQILDNWSIDEVEQLVELANERLVLTGDVELALRALRLAEDRVSELADPGLLSVRKQLALDIAELEAVYLPDLNGITLKLSTLIEQVGVLPLVNDVPVRELISSEKSNVTEAEFNNTLTGFGRRLISDLATLVRIRNIETTRTPRVATDQRLFVYESVRIPLRSAQLALLSGLEKIYRSSLEDARNALDTQFDHASENVHRFRSSINELMEIELTYEYPDISTSLQLLAQFDKKQSSAR